MSLWSRAGKKGEGSALHHHWNFSEVFSSSDPSRHSSEPPRLPHSTGEGMAFELCVWFIWAQVSGPRALPCAGTCDKSRAGPAGPRGASQHEPA